MSQRRDDSEEARRILDRIDREQAPLASGLARRTADRLHDHMAASDADQSDPIEVWGTRIGRILGIVVMTGLVLYLVSILIGG